MERGPAASWDGRWAARGHRRFEMHDRPERRAGLGLKHKADLGPPQVSQTRTELAHEVPVNARRGPMVKVKVNAAVCNPTGNCCKEQIENYTFAARALLV